jgi:hypothetical protein
MRCRACNKNLNDFESTRKSESGEYVDLCNHCYREVQSDILAEERQDLQDGNDEWFDEDDGWIELDFDLDD